MSLASSVALPGNPLPEWTRLFAKEPVPALDPTQPDMDKTVVLGPPGRQGPTPPTSRERILFLVLVLIIVGGGSYLAVNPDLLMGLLGDSPGEMSTMQTAVPPKPPVAKTATPAPAPGPGPAPDPASTLPPAQPAAPAAAPAAPAPATAAAPAPAPTPTSAPAMASAPKPASAPSVPAIPTPKFGEGEKVSVTAPTPLTVDSAGKKPGSITATPGTTLTVLDADLQNFAWVYSVRTEQGTTGWVAEKNLVAK